MRVGIFIDGTFIPERDGASTRFAFLPAKLVESGVDVVVFHCFRGWSQLEKICTQPFPTYFFQPEVFYTDLRLLKNLMQDHHLDVIQINDAETMHLLGFPLATALRLHTVFEAHYHTSTLMRQLDLPAERINSVKRLETEVSRFSDEIITFTEQDRLRWVELSGCNKKRVSVVPFGVPCVDAAPEQEEPRLVFLGNMYYEPNQRAVERIVRTILPAVRVRRPDVRIMLVGDVPGELQALCEGSAVEMVGEVGDVRSCLHRCSVGLAPISEGTGVRAKILQYLSCGLPVVATSVAAEGLSFPALFVEDDSDGYVQLCVELLNGQREYKSRVKSTMNMLQREYLWEVIARQASAVYEKVMRRTPRERPHGKPKDCGPPLWIEEVILKKRFSTPLTVLNSSYRFGLAARGIIETYR